MIKKGQLQPGQTSHSNTFLHNRGSRPPPVSALMANSVSEYRRNILAEEVEAGLFSDGSSNTQTDNSKLTQNSNVTALVGINKFGQVASGGGYRGSGDTTRQIPEVYSPLWLTSNLNLPRDRATINAWCRAFYALNPFVQNAIDLHSTYPISKLNIKCSNPKVQQFFNEMIEELDLMNICTQIAHEYWLLGESFIYAELDRSKGKWSRLLLQNPDYMLVLRSIMANEPVIMLKPDEELKRVVSSNKPADIEQRRKLDPYIVNAVKKGNNIPLPNFNVSHLARKISPYEIRGTGLPVCIFRSLMLFDKMRESKFAQAENMINPLTLIKIGSADFKPTPADLEQWREIFAQAQSDRDFKIFTHEAIDISKVGSASGIYDITSDVAQVMKEIFVGLQVPPVLMDGGADTTYANGGVALDVLRQRYMQFRNMMSLWLKRKIFAPISEMQDFYEYEEGSEKLIVPEIDWNHMSLFDAGDYINTLTTLTQGEGEQKRVSIITLYRSLGLEWEDERRKMKKEAIAGAIAEKEAIALKSMSLNELRALSDEDEIPEPPEGTEVKETPVPGEITGGGGDLPDLTLPGLDSGGSGMPPPPPTSTGPIPPSTPEAGPATPPKG